MILPAWTVLHEMRYETAECGEDEYWVCDECGKKVRVWPDYTVLERGDRTAVHYGSHGGLTITGLEVKTT